MGRFFRDGPVTDLAYKKIRDFDDAHLVDCRCYLEQIWQECRHYVDPDAAEKATQDFHAVFWELHLANALKHAGKHFVPRTQLGLTNNRGPDLFAHDPDVWIEAVAVRAGHGPDALEDVFTPSVAYQIQPDKLVLRLRSVIEDKAEKLREYLDAGIIQAHQSSVIAISGVALPFRYKYYGAWPLPIVRAVFGAGNLVLEFDRETKELREVSAEYKGAVQKSNGAPVSTDIFARDGLSHVSAVLYSESSCNYMNDPGEDFCLVHNRNAAVPLPRGWLPCGQEYWLNDDDVICRRVPGD